MTLHHRIFSAALVAILATTAMAHRAAAQQAAPQTAEAVLAATDQWARAYAAGSAPRTAMPGATADPSTLGTNGLAAVVGQYDEDATYAGTLQPFWLRGRAQIQDLWSRYFARYPDRRMIFRDRQAQVYGSTAVETGYAEMYMGASPQTSVPTFLRYSITRTMKNGQWLIASMIVDRIPSDQPPAGTMPPGANTQP